MYTILYSLYIVYCIRLVRSTGILSNSLLEASVIEASLFEAVPFKKSLWILAQPVPILEPPALGPEGVARSTPWREWQGPPRGRSGEVPPAEGVARSPRGGSGEPPPPKGVASPPPPHGGSGEVTPRSERRVGRSVLHLDRLLNFPTRRPTQ